MAKFNLIDALTADGFETIEERDFCGGGDSLLMNRVFTREITLCWHPGETYVTSLEVTLRIDRFKSGEYCGVWATFSNGKSKYYGYDKRAYNAIRDTVKYAGYEYEKVSE